MKVTLTEAECEALLDLGLEFDNMHSDWARLRVFEAVARIVAKRMEADRQWRGGGA
jgi:hypothetical protein